MYICVKFLDAPVMHGFKLRHCAMKASASSAGKYIYICTRINRVLYSHAYTPVGCETRAIAEVKPPASQGPPFGRGGKGTSATQRSSCHSTSSCLWAPLSRWQRRQLP